MRCSAGPSGPATDGLKPVGYNERENALPPGDLRWLSPLPLWTGILAGPLAWACDLSVSYALVKWSCLSQREAVLHLITIGFLAVVAGAAWLSWEALRRTAAAGSTSGANPLQRARFMAVLGLASSALFALTIVALAIPRWVLDACR